MASLVSQVFGRTDIYPVGLYFDPVKYLVLLVEGFMLIIISFLANPISDVL